MTSQKQDSGWTLFPEEVLFETPAVKLVSGPVICQRSGAQKNFFRFDFPDWVNVVAITAEREIVLIEQYRYGSGRVEVEIPGGIIERGESPIDAGCRELLEECGYIGSKALVIGQVNPNPAVQSNYCYTVLVEDAVQVAEQQLDEMEDIKVFLRPVKDVLYDIRAGGSDITHGLVLNALSFYENIFSKTSD